MKPTAATERELRDLSPTLRIRVRALIEACPYPLGITSAWRSPEEQMRLYRAWRAYKAYRDGRGPWAPKANPANPPGVTKHDDTGPDGEPASNAADLRYPGARGTRQRAECVAWVHANAHEFGLHFPIRSEDWHAESNGRPYSPPAPVAPEEDDVPLTAAEKNEVAELAASKAYSRLHPEIVLVLHGSDKGHIGIDQLKEQLDGLAPRLVTADGRKVCLVSPATGAVHVVNPVELAAWRAAGVISRDAKPQTISPEHMAALEQAAQVRR